MAFWRNYIHLIWTTKNRQPLIREAIEPHLYAQMVNKATELECFVYCINGTTDHVHLVLSIPPKHSVAEIVKTIKGASSHFVNHVLRSVAIVFEWQQGYGCFSLGHSQLAVAIAYVEAQKTHHAQYTTNAWLEKTAEVDEGPITSIPIITPKNTLREDSVTDDSMGDLPF